MSESRQVGSGKRRPTPPPREANDQMVTVTITLGWLIALVVLVAAHGLLAADVRWWVWTCVLGVAMGIFGLLYVPHLKRKRARLAAEKAAPPAEPTGAGTQLSSGYVSRDNGSNTVSSTETPGKSTRS